jgi:hypothetical protein
MHSFLKHILGRTPEEHDDHPTQATLNTRLLKAAEKGKVAAIKDALAHGADINAQGHEELLMGNREATPLDLAVQGNYVAAVITLLEAGAEVNALDTPSRTAPLNRAVHYIGQKKMAKALLAAGADIDDEMIKTGPYWGEDHSTTAGRLADYLQSIKDDPRKRPTPAEVGLDMDKRNAALRALAAAAAKPKAGKYEMMEAERERQRQAAINDPNEGI